MEKIKIAGRYLKYFANAKTLYKIHSPFVYDLLEKVFEDKRTFYAFDKAEGAREHLLRNDSIINVTDLGAGSINDNSNKRVVSTIAKHALSPPAQCEFLFRLINHYKPERMIEIGTSLGVATLYQAAANKNGRLITLEGCPEIAKIAKSQFRRLNMHNIEMVVGNFDNTLVKTLEKLQRLDYIFIDGNHRKLPTVIYFKQALLYAHNDTIFVLDDIHWSQEMEEAWHEITQMDEVGIALDFFYFGLVFIRQEAAEKINEVIVHAAHKPWSMGFFK